MAHRGRPTLAGQYLILNPKREVSGVGGPPFVVTLYSRAYARDRSRNASPPLGSRSLPLTAAAWSALLFGVDQTVRSMMGSGEARLSKLTARAERTGIETD